MSNRTVSVGSKFPEFKKKVVVASALNADAPGKEFAEITNAIHMDTDKWMVMFW